MLTSNFSSFDMDSDRVLDFDQNSFVQKFVPKKYLNYDLSLFATKWFDYRRMTPLQATIEYMKAFCESYKDTYARELDFQRAEFVTPVNITKLFTDLIERQRPKDKSKLTSFWRGRQVADALGMPYNVYLDHAFEYRMRRWQRAYLPQPQHLYHEYVVEMIQEKWEDLKKSRLYLPDDPAFLSQNYRDIPYQNDFHDYLIAQAAERSDPAFTLSGLVETDMLPLEKLEKTVDTDLFDRVVSYL